MSKYIAFISYKHEENNRKIAILLENAIKRYAKSPFSSPPVLFRDEKIMVPNIDLNEALKKHMDSSEHLIFLANPESAKSIWCIKELEHWLANPGNENKLIIVLTSGKIIADDNSIDWENTNALPKELSLKLKGMPFYIDLSSFETIDSLNLSNPKFAIIINSIVAKLRGVNPQDLNDENIRIVKRNRIIRNVALSIIGLLFFSASLLGVIANNFNKDRIRADEDKIKALQENLRLDEERIKALDSLSTVDKLRLKSQEAALENEKEAIKNLILAQENQEKAILEEKKKNSNYLATIGLNPQLDYLESLNYALQSDSLNEGNIPAITVALEVYFNKVNYRLIEEKLYSKDTMYHFNELQIPHPLIKNKYIELIENGSKSKLSYSDLIPENSYENIFCSPDDTTRIRDISILDDRFVKLDLDVDFASIFFDLDRRDISLLRPFSINNDEVEISECDSVLNLDYQKLKSKSIPHNLHLVPDYSINSYETEGVNNLLLLEQDFFDFETKSYKVFRYENGNTQDLNLDEFVRKQTEFMAFSRQNDLAFYRVQDEHNSNSGEIVIHNTVSGEKNYLNLDKERSVKGFQPQNILLSKDQNYACVFVSDWEYNDKCLFFNMDDQGLVYYRGFDISEYETPIAFSQESKYLVTKEENTIKFYNIELQQLAFSIPYNLENEEIFNLRFDESLGYLHIQTSKRYQKILIKKNNSSFEHGLGRFSYGEFTDNEKFLVLRDYGQNTFLVWDILQKNIVLHGSYEKIFTNSEKNVFATFYNSLLTIYDLKNSGDIESLKFEINGLKDLVYTDKRYLWYVDDNLSLIRLSLINGMKKNVDKCYHDEYYDNFHISANKNSILFINQKKKLIRKDFMLNVLDNISLPDSLFRVIRDINDLSPSARKRSGITFPMSSTRIYNLELSPGGEYKSFKASIDKSFRGNLYMLSDNGKKWSIKHSGSGALEWITSATYKYGDSIYEWNHNPISAFDYLAYSPNKGLVLRNFQDGTKRNRFQISNLNENLDIRFELDMGFEKYPSGGSLFSKDANYLFVGVDCAICYNTPIVVIPTSVKSIAKEILD